MPDMLLTTTDTIPGDYTPLGLVLAAFGSAGGFRPGHKAVADHTVKLATGQLDELAAEAVRRYPDADGLIGIRFSVTNQGGVWTTLVSGTAIKRG